MDKLMVGLLVIAMLPMVGCSKKKKNKISQQAAINACLWDPTGNCPRQAAALAAANAPAVLPYLGQYNNLAQPQPPAAIPPTPAVVTTQSIEQQIRQQAAMVQQKIKEDSLNPNSIHYDPPQPITRASASVSAPPPVARTASAPTMSLEEQFEAIIPDYGPPTPGGADSVR